MWDIVKFAKKIKVAVFDFDGTATDAEEEGEPYIAGFLGDLVTLTGLPAQRVIELAAEYTKKVSPALMSGKKNVGTFSQTLKVQAQEADQKLDELVDAFLEGIVDKEIYLKKKAKLIKQKTDLAQQKSVFSQRGELWIEPFKEFWKDLNLAKKLISSNNFIEIKSFVAKNGSNPSLLAKKVSWSWSKPFEIALRYTEKNNSVFAGGISKTHLNFERTVLSGKQDLNLRPTGPKPVALAN